MDTNVPLNIKIAHHISTKQYWVIKTGQFTRLPIKWPKRLKLCTALPDDLAPKALIKPRWKLLIFKPEIQKGW
jgi:hypothetical protein